MNGGLAFLLIRSLRGRAVQMLRKLREPRYLLGALVTGAWLLLVFGDVIGGGGEVRFGPGNALAEEAGPETIRAVTVLLGVLLAAVFSVWWLVPWGRRPLELDEAELHLLLPAPVPRRAVIQYAVLKSQSGVLVGTAVLTFFWGGDDAVGRLAALPAFWLLLTLWDLHGKARGLWLARQDEIPPARAWMRRAALVLLMAAAWATILGQLTEVVGLAVAHPWEGGAEAVRSFLEIAAHRLEGGPLTWILAPFLWALRPLLGQLSPAGGILHAAWNLAPAVALLVIHNEWVVRSQVRFEEASLTEARRRARRADPAARFWKISERRRRQIPFTLGPRGAPETGILWKNLILFRRGSLKAAAAIGVLAAVTLAVVVCLPGVPGWLFWAVFFAAAASLPLGPLIAGRSLRNDLRSDLLRLEIVRPWPIPGWKLFAAELGAPVVLALLQVCFSALLLLLLDLVGALVGIPQWIDARLRIAEILGAPPALLIPLLLVGFAPVAVVVAGLASALENLAALLFPSWVQLGLAKKQAAAAMGQNILVFLALSLAFSIALLPGALAVAVMVAVQWLVWGLPPVAWEAPVLGLLFALPVAAVVAASIAAGGRLWEGLDPSAELLSGDP